MAAEKLPPIPILETLTPCKSKKRKRSTSKKFEKLVLKTKRRPFYVLGVRQGSDSSTRQYEILNKYRIMHLVTLGDNHHCSCMSLQENNFVCPATLFVLLRVLQMKETSKYVMCILTICPQQPLCLQVAISNGNMF